MPHQSKRETVLREGHAELEAVRRELLTLVDAEPENGDARREAFEVSGLADRVEWLLAEVPDRATPRVLFTGDLDLALLEKFADDAELASPYRGDRPVIQRPERAQRLRALRDLLAERNYGAPPD